MEAEAVKAIIQRIEHGVWEGVSSAVIQYEIAKMPDTDRSIEVGLMVRKMQVTATVNSAVREKALILEDLGFTGVDALHLACAQLGKADVFLTTDDRLQKRAVRYAKDISIDVDNPLRWFERMVRK